MKTIVVILLLLVSNGYAQTKKPVKKPVQKPTTQAMSSLDSLSYAMGVQTAEYFKIDGVAKINSEMVKRAYDDVYNSKPLLIPDQQCSMTIQTRLQQIMAD